MPVVWYGCETWFLILGGVEEWSVESSLEEEEQEEVVRVTGKECLMRSSASFT